MIQKSRSKLLICGALILLMLCLIWGNSMLPGKASGNVSGWFGRLLGQILPVFGPDNPNGSFLLRKCAHFTEFCLLGTLLCWMSAMCQQKKRWVFSIAFGCGALTAAIDECIQLFVPERHGCGEDVLLDCCGVATGVLLVLLVFHIVNNRTVYPSEGVK